MRTLMAIGLVAAVSATAGAQFGDRAWASPMRDVVVVEAAAHLAVPPVVRGQSVRPRIVSVDRDVAPNPYFATSDIGAVAAPSLSGSATATIEPNPYLDEANPYRDASNPYFDEFPVTHRAAAALVHSPVVVRRSNAGDVEPNPYELSGSSSVPRTMHPSLATEPREKVQVEQNPYRL